MSFPIRLACLPLSVLSVLSVTAIFGCGKKDPDDKDKPNTGDKIQNLVTGKPLYSTLNPYNEGWSGKISLDTGEIVPLSLEVLIPQSIEDVIRREKEQLSKYAFAEVTLTAEGFKLPATGSVSHHNVIRFDQTVHSALEDREFVSMGFAFASVDAEEGSDRYKQLSGEEVSKFRKMLAALTPTFVAERTRDLYSKSVELLMERLDSDTLEGIVVTSKMNEAKTKIGSVQLKRSLDPIKALHKTTNTMETEAYLFNAIPNGGGMSFYTIRK